MSNHRYKIVYCTPALYSAGGIERVISLKASYFADVFGYDVTVIVTEGKGKQSFFPLSGKVKVVNLDLNFEELWGTSFIKRSFSLSLQTTKISETLISRINAYPSRLYY